MTKFYLFYLTRWFNIYWLGTEYLVSIQTFQISFNILVVLVEKNVNYQLNIERQICFPHK